MLMLIDFNNLMWRTMHVKDVDIHSDVPNVLFWQYLIFDNIYQSFTSNDKIDEVVLAIDDRNQWRRSYFSRYKESRKVKREKTGINFDFAFDIMNKYIAELKHYMPFKVLKVRAAEADDIIGTLAMVVQDKIIISSNDEDYLQCLSDRVKVWNPSKKEYVKCEYDPRTFLTMKCLMGQPKDDIFNVKTPINWGKTEETFGKKKPGLGPVSAKKIIQEGLEDWLEKNNVTHRFKRNMNLIDFTKIPRTIQNRIISAYNDYSFPPPKNMLEFFKKYQMRQYIENYHIVERCLMRLY